MCTCCLPLLDQLPAAVLVWPLSTPSGSNQCLWYGPLHLQRALSVGRHPAQSPQYGSKNYKQSIAALQGYRSGWLGVLVVRAHGSSFCSEDCQ